MLLLARQIILCWLLFPVSCWSSAQAQDVVGCGGFVQSEVDINYSLIQVSAHVTVIKYKAYKTQA